MHLTSEKTSLFILGVTAIICSRAMLLSINDPEGPNLLVVLVMAVVIYGLSLLVYAFNFSSSKKLALAIVIQVATVTVLYFFLR